MLPVRAIELREVLEIDPMKVVTESVARHRFLLVLADKASTRFLLAYHSFLSKQSEGMARYLMHLYLIFGVPRIIGGDMRVVSLKLDVFSTDADGCAPTFNTNPLTILEVKASWKGNEGGFKTSYRNCASSADRRDVHIAPACWIKRTHNAASQCFCQARYASCFRDLIRSQAAHPARHPRSADGTRGPYNWSNDPRVEAQTFLGIYAARTSNKHARLSSPESSCPHTITMVPPNFISTLSSKGYSVLWCKFCIFRDNSVMGNTFAI